MSEAEKQRRSLYRENRKKWIKIQSIILAAVMLVTVVSFFAFSALNKATYIEYAEDGKIEYKVGIKESEFYDSAILDKDKSYVTSLINSVSADLKYGLIMNADNVDFEYSYSVDAVMKVTDGKSGAVIFDRVENLVPEKQFSAKGDSLKINESVTVDYSYYESLARQFVGVYDLDGTKSDLAIVFNVQVIGDCEEFDDETTNSYTMALNMPLNEKTMNPSLTSDVGEVVKQILACKNVVLRNVFFGITLGFAILSVIVAIVLAFFVYLTRNTDINYDIKVSRIFKNYRSFIQKITNAFDTRGYQLLYVGSFSEMLEIHDTIHSPILMNENEDKTCTTFYIPTSGKLLYVFDIKVDDYDEIYGEPEAEAEEIVVPEDVVIIPEEIVVPEGIVKEDIIEAICEPDIDLKDIDFEDTPDEEVEDGVEVIDVVWPEKEKKNKLYRYDPDGETIHDGDIVLVPSRDATKGKDIVRKATVAHGNHRVSPEIIHHPLKKIIAVVKRKAEDILSQ